ncbi:MAG TPA: polyphosphate kinase 1 [Thermoleophilaceae bacterium]|nr:polyphosphate kinase 1 [Thermoleophilaceae bacterium]
MVMTIEQTAPPTLDSPDLYINRELSWLDFNERVLELAEEPERMPLLERLKFLAIYESNLDEFFMVRVAGLHDQVDAGVLDPGADGLTPSETIDEIGARVRELDRRHGAAFTDVAVGLSRHGIRIVRCDECTAAELEEVDRAYAEQIFPVLTPLAVGPGRPFPYISNLSLSIAVILRDPVSGVETFARVKVPKEVLPRFVRVAGSTFVPLEHVIARHLDRLFPGMEIVRHDFFRVTRDADFTVSDEADDLLRAVEDELRRRRFGEVVRLEVNATIDPELRAHLIDWLEVEERQVYDVDGPLDLADLWEVYDIGGHRELRETPWIPIAHPAFAAAKEDERVDIFEAIRSRDLLVHHPYESFAMSVERFVAQAVRDPDVLAVKITVYRTSDDSALVPSLIEAAERGKQAVCLVELTARFDERRNIRWARSLEEAGAHVVHGIPGLKTHAKAVLVVRREAHGLRRYVHIGTGNYNSKTARNYEDVGIFTCDEAISADVADLFNSLTGMARAPRYRKVLVSPEYTREGIIDEIRRCTEAGPGARIRMKMNALVDRSCIRALYEASQAGVQVDLCVRGICRLRPGVEGVSENIRVVSVVGRFLEHSRIYGFERGEETRWWLGSADLMPRNLDNRVELLTPVEDPAIAAYLAETLDRSLEDDTFCWELGPDGIWNPRRAGERALHRELMERATERHATAD